MISFRRLVSKNFMIFESIDLQLNSYGLALIEGNNKDASSLNSNGSGKSTIIDALCYALYGKSYRGLPNAKLFRKGAESFYVGVTFADRHGHEYMIERSRTQNPDAYTFSVIKLPEMTPIVPTDAKDLQDILTGLLGMSWQLFQHLVLSGEQSTHNQIVSFGQLPDSQKMSILEEILVLDLFTKSGQLASAKAQAKKDELSENYIELRGLNGSLSREQSRVDDLRRKAANWGGEREVRILDAEGCVGEWERSIQDLQELLRNNQVMESPEADLERVTAEHSEISQRIKGLGYEFQNIIKDAVPNFQVLNMQIQHLKDRLGRWRNTSLKSLCEFCNQEVDPGKISGETEKAELEALEKQFFDGKKTQNELDATFQQLRNDLEDELAQLDARKKELAGQVKSYMSHQMKMAGVEQQLAHAQQSLKQSHVTLMQIKTEQSPFKELLDQGYRSLEDLNAQVDKVANAQREAERKAKQFDILSMLFGPKGVRSHVFENLLPEINELLIKYSQRFSDGAITAFLNVFTYNQDGTRREKISIDVLNPTGGDTYKAMSPGERRRINIPISFGLIELAARRGIGANLLFLDEVFGNIDTAGNLSMLNLLRETFQERSATALDSVLVISHKPDIVDMFDKTITVTKENGRSTISVA